MPARDEALLKRILAPVVEQLCVTMNSNVHPLPHTAKVVGATIVHAGHVLVCVGCWMLEAAGEPPEDAHPTKESTNADAEALIELAMAVESGVPVPPVDVT